MERKKKTNNYYKLVSRSVCCALIIILSFVSPASGEEAQGMIKYDISSIKDISKKKKYTHFVSGTGFYVTNNHIVTNEHVVQACRKIRIRGAVEPSYASLAAVDTGSDLALLHTDSMPKRIAPLRGTSNVKIGEPISVIGYPLARGVKGTYSLKKAHITQAEDIFDSDGRIQFTDVVKKGNSGGPLLDRAGLVVGVVVGKMSFYLADASGKDLGYKPIKTSSVGISVRALKDFLDTNKVHYINDNTKYDYPTSEAERKAKDYIVNIHCIKS